MDIPRENNPYIVLEFTQQHPASAPKKYSNLHGVCAAQVLRRAGKPRRNAQAIIPRPYVIEKEVKELEASQRLNILVGHITANRRA